MERIALRPGVYRGRKADGRWHLLDDWAEEPLPESGAWLEAVLQRLSREPATRDELRRLGQHEGAPGPDRLDALLGRLQDGGWLASTVVCNGRERYTLEPLRHPPGPPPRRAALEQVLSRFAILRRRGDTLTLESPRAWCAVRIHDPAVLTAVAELAMVPSPEHRAGPDGAGLPPALAARLRRDLAWGGIAVPAAEAEESELRLRQWSVYELWFHERSRCEVPGSGFGGTDWARGVFDPLPARHAAFAGPVVELHRPDLDHLRVNDPSVTSVLEGRRTVRQYDDRAPVSVRQLGEFLFRCARNRYQVCRDGLEYLNRPYPNGGSFYELELYPVVRRVAGLAAGMYHYDPQEHRLQQVSGSDPAVRRLLWVATWSNSLTHPPQVLLVVAARFGRVMWKYEGMAYALILKHVGVLYQMMYTVATAMGLAPCGLGGGDPRAFADATGLDPLEEGSVGEFMLGSLPARRPDGEGRPCGR